MTLTIISYSPDMTSEALQEYFLKNYSSNCHSFSYLRSYEFFALSLHILSPFSAFLGVYGIVVIVMATPKSMESAKWFILHLHVTTFTIEIVLNLLLVPFIFLPSGAIYSTGILLQMGFPFKITHLVCHQSFTIYSIAIVMLFENRHSLVTSIKYRMTRRITKILYYTANYLIAIPIMLSPFIMETVDSDAEKLRILQRIPCPEKQFFDVKTQVITTNIEMAYTTEAVLVHYFSFTSLFFSLQSGYHLLKKPNFNISEKTRNLQKKFFFSLVIQLFTPFAVMVVPLFLFFITLKNGIIEQFLSSLIIITCSVHGLLSSTFLILLHKPYRDYTRNMTIGKVLRLPIEKTSTNTSFHRSRVISTM
uniref:Serpentine Receptor, class H n=1 Tax=Caenorhabditis tropicalis TaxID=1561998 RepID=A0A1I7TW19_9PELO